VAATTASTGGGGFAVQLAGAGSESEARATISRLQQRYGAALGGRQPVVRKATVGDRDVYRVRVVGLSQGDANGLCERLKSAGGTCFIARE
jgi:cell division septation protein DedD